MKDYHLPESPKEPCTPSPGSKIDRLRSWLQNVWRWITFRNAAVVLGLTGIVWFSLHCMRALKPVVPKGASVSDLISANRLIVYKGINYFVPEVSELYLESREARQYRSEVLGSKPMESAYYYVFHGGTMSQVESHIDVNVAHLDEVFAVVHVSKKAGSGNYELFAGIELPHWNSWVLTNTGWKFYGDHYSLAQALSQRDMALSLTLSLNLQLATSSSLARK